MNGRGFAYFRWAVLNSQCWSSRPEFFNDEEGHLCSYCSWDFEELNRR